MMMEESIGIPIDEYADLEIEDETGNIYSQAGWQSAQCEEVGEVIWTMQNIL